MQSYRTAKTVLISLGLAFVLINLVLLATLSYARRLTLKVTVFDGLSGKPLAGVDIILASNAMAEDAADAQVVAGTTDEMGAAQLFITAKEEVYWVVPRVGRVR